MQFSLIPWHVFVEALRQQQPGAIESWLRRWLFTNEGVFLSATKKS